MRNEGVNLSRLLVETQLERQDDWETLAQRNIDLQLALEAQRRAAAQAQAAADAQAANDAQLEAARIAAAEAEIVPQVMLPTDDEATDQAVLVSGTTDAVTEPGPYAQELETQLAGLTIPEDLQVPVDNLRAATAEADALIAEGYHEQGTAMYAAIQYASEPIVTALVAAQVAPVTAQAAPASAQTIESQPVAQKAAQQTATSPLEQAPLAAPNDYFTGSFDAPPPGGWFWAIGDAGRTGQDGVYQWLSEAVTARARASEHGAYLLAGSDQVTSVGQHLRDAAAYPVGFEFEVYGGEGEHYTQTQTRMLSRDETIAELRNRGNDDSAIATYLGEHEQYMVQASYFSGGEDGTVVPAVYGTRDAYLSAIGLPLDVPMDLQIAFNYSGAGSGDAWLDASHARMSMAGGGVERAYVAIVDDRLAADWAQIGDIGPINDDVNEMLGDIYGRYGATTPEQQEAVRNVLFKYDERFGVLANREFVEAAVEKNNARRQGFFEGPVGRAILSVAASFIPGVGPYVSMMLNAGFQLSDGASFGQVIAGAAVSYFTQQYTADFGNYVAGAFGDSISPAVAEVIAAGARNLGNTAINQLMSGNGLDGEGLLLAAAAGGFGSFITNFVDGSDFGKVLDEQFGRGRAGDIIGRLGASAVDGKLSASDFVGAFAAGRADQVTTVEGADGTHVFVKTDTGMITRNPDGSITQLDEGDDGQVVATTYDSDGNRIVSADAFTGALANPVWRTATLSDALTDQLTGESLFTGLEDIFGLAAGSVSFDGFTPDFDGTLSLFGSVLGGASPLELAALQEGGYGLDATMTSFVPDDVAVDAPPPDLTSKTYTKDQNGLETWRDPDTGAIIKQRDANGAMLEVVGDRRVITDPQGKVVSVQGGTRGEALRQARDSGSGLVEWNGKLYTTVTEEDLVRQSGQSVKAFREFKATKGGTYADFQAEITANKWGVLAQGGVDTKYWQSQGFTPELVAVTYAVNGNDHRLATMKPNETVAVDSLALNIANNLANLPAGFGELYRSAVNGFTAFAQSQEINGQTMTFTELMGAGVNYLLNAGQSAAKRLVDNTDSTGEAVLVAVGGGFQAIINSFKGGVEALDSLGKPLTPQQAAVETLKLFGGIASVFGVTGLARGAVAGTAVTTEGLSAASNVTVRTLADAAGLLLPDNPGSVVKHMDFLSPGPQPTALANVDDVSARIAAVDLAVETKHFYDSFDSARDIATVLVGPLSDSLGVARGRASVYDLALRESLFDYQNVGGTVPRLSDGTWIFPVGTRPDGLEFIGFDAFAPSIVRHEAQHVLDYAAAALDPASPYLLRMEWPNSGSSLYKGFAYTELNGFGITAEELSRSYVFAMANGDVAGAANALKGYQSILGTYDGLMGRVEEVLGNAVSQPSRSLMAQTMTASPAVPKNSGFQVVEFQIIGPEGLPVKMSAEVQAGLTPAQMNDAVTEQMISGLNQLDAYVDFRAARAADLAALKQHYQQQVGTPNTGNGGGNTGGRGGGLDP